MMLNVSGLFRRVRQRVTMLLLLIVDAVCSLGLCLRPSPTLAAENLFLRKQLTLYQERQIKPRQATDAIRLAMIWLARWFDWRSALNIVKPETFTRWHRQGFRWFWRCKARPGRPPIPGTGYPTAKTAAADLSPAPSTPDANRSTHGGSIRFGRPSP